MQPLPMAMQPVPNLLLRANVVTIGVATMGLMQPLPNLLLRANVVMLHMLGLMQPLVARPRPW